MFAYTLDFPSHRDFGLNVSEYLTVHVPEYGEIVFTEQQKNMLRKYDHFFVDLELIGANHVMYNLHRSLAKSEEVFHDLSNEIVSKWLQPQTNILVKRLTSHDDGGCVDCLEKDIATIRDIKAKKERTMHRQARFFRIIYSLVSLIDILVPVGLILAISKVSYYGEELFGSALGLFVFVAFVTILKVVLDRYLVMPLVERLGWKWYRKQVQTLIYSSTILVGAIFALDRGNKHDINSSQMLADLERGMDELRK